MRHFLIFIPLLLLVSRLAAQDTLYFKNHEKVVIQLLEVNPDNIKYKRFDNKEGATYTVLKNEVDQIALSNGKKEIFKTEPTARISSPDTSISVTPTVAIPAQAACDTLVFRTGKRQPVKIYELTPTQAHYKLMANLDGPLYKTNKSEIKEIVFATGMKQTFNESAAESNNPSQNYASMVLKGMEDADKYYKNSTAAIATGIISLYPLAGLIPAVICSNVPPRQRNLGYPDEKLWQNSDYRTAYVKQAYKIKKKRVWRGFGIGTGTIIITVLIAGIFHL